MLVPFPTHTNILFDTDKTFFEIEHLLFTLDSVVELFNQYFPEKMNRSLVVSLSSSYGCPICFRSEQKIFLDTTTYSWCQAAYQFSHELCHYMIPSDVCSSLRWFEESICELASYFFVPKLTDLWKEKDISFKTSSGELYANTFVPYIKNDMAKSVPFDIYSNENIEYLEHNCYEREMNKHIANILLPIFSKTPETWHAIPCLCKIPPNQTLLNSLLDWKNLAPSYSHKGIDAILQVFRR